MTLVRTLAAGLLAAAALVGADSIPTCDPQNLCPESSPCCSQYGQCGVGAYCLGGCDPVSSFSLDSCMAGPVCKSGNFALNSLDDVAPNTQYLGDPSTTNWVSSGSPAVYQNKAMLLTMAPGTVGTLLTSTHYVWYGKISATMTTSQGAGVVTAFIMMSDVKDEIDFEFVGVDLETAQSNYYWQGVPDYHNSANLSVSNTRENMHTYTFDWTPDTLSWAIDGKVLRTLNRADTYNATTGEYHYPQTPARIQLSLWPAGLSTNAPGTIAWAGGEISWNSPYMQHGYYYNLVESVQVDCYNPPAGFAQNFGSKAYYYTDRIGTNTSVAIGNNNTVLASLLASGDDPHYNPNPAASSSAGSAPSSSATPQSIPGVVGTGSYPGAGSVPPSPNSGSSAGGASSSSGSADPNVFVPGTNVAKNRSDAAPKVAAGSAVALLAFFVAALLL